MNMLAKPVAAPGAQSQQGDDPSQYLDLPFVLPVYERIDNPTVPGATRLNNPETKRISFQTPRPPFGDFTLQGWYAWLAVVNPDPATRGRAPLIWVEPNGGVFSSELPLGPAAPQYIGAQEGNRFEYFLQTANKTNTPVADDHSHTNYMLNPLANAPIRIQAGAENELTVTRRECAFFFPDNPVYLFFGVFGSLRYLLPPSYKPDACVSPVQPLEVLGRDVTAPTDNTLGVFSRTVQTRLSINKQHPMDINQIRYAGAEHLFCKVTFQSGLGSMSNDWIPARIFQRIITGGVLPQPMRVNAQTTIDIDVVQPIVVPDQLPATGRFSLGGGIYGY